MPLAKRVRDWEEPVVLYEIIPPPESAPEEEVRDMAQFIRTLLHEHGVDAINIPEVRSETRAGARMARFIQKMDPRKFGTYLRKASGESWEIVVNHSPVHAPEEAERKWFEETFLGYGMTDVVLVGGESSKIAYVGPSVSRAGVLGVDVARRVLPDGEKGLLLGAITIPERRRKELDEPERMLAKARGGIDFFTSQVLFEPEAAKALLHDYDLLCRKEREEPRPVFLSFAPVTGRKDVEFLEWLGVRIPAHAREWILGSPGAIERGARVAEHTFRDILWYVHQRDLRVPLGLNVEHVMRYNLDASEVLLDRLESLVDWHRLEFHTR